MAKVLLDARWNGIPTSVVATRTGCAVLHGRLWVDIGLTGSGLDLLRTRGRSLPWGCRKLVIVYHQCPGFVDVFQNEIFFMLIGYGIIENAWVERNSIVSKHS